MATCVTFVKQAVSLPNNATFDLKNIGYSKDSVDIFIGTKMCFQLVITFPISTTDMLVELFMPDISSIVMMLCDVTVTNIGDNLVMTKSGNIVMDSKNSSKKFVSCIMF